MNSQPFLPMMPNGPTVAYGQTPMTRHPRDELHHTHAHDKISEELHQAKAKISMLETTVQMLGGDLNGKHAQSFALHSELYKANCAQMETAVANSSLRVQLLAMQSQLGITETRTQQYQLARDETNQALQDKIHEAMELSAHLKSANEELEQRKLKIGEMERIIAARDYQITVLRTQLNEAQEDLEERTCAQSLASSPQQTLCKQAVEKDQGTETLGDIFKDCFEMLRIIDMAIEKGEISSSSG